MTTITLQTVAASDLLTLAAAPTPTMIPSVSKRTGIDPMTRAVVAASLPSARRTECRALPTIDLTPRPARSHLALEGSS